MELIHGLKKHSGILQHKRAVCFLSRNGDKWAVLFILNMKDVGIGFVSHVCCFLQSRIPQEAGTKYISLFHHAF